MMLGGLAFLYPFNFKYRRLLSFLGIAAIVIACFYYDEHTRWPSYRALLPTLGAYLVIISRSELAIFSNYVVEKLGLWSYSIYLIHWPILVFLNHINTQINFFVYLFCVIFSSFILYELVEKRRSYKFGLLIFYSITLIFAIFVNQDGIKNRVPEEYRLTGAEFKEKYAAGFQIASQSPVDGLNPDGANKVVLTGDSFAWQYAGFLSQHGFNVHHLTTGSCISTEHYFNTWQNNLEVCEQIYPKLLSLLEKHPDVKIIIQAQAWKTLDHGVNRQNRELLKNDSFDVVLDELAIFIQKLRPDQHFVIIGSQLETPYNIYECLGKQTLELSSFIGNICPKTQPYKIGERNKFNDELRKFASQYKNVHYIDPNDYLCQNGQCILIIDGQPVFSDLIHLSNQGVELVGSEIATQINLILSPSKWSYPTSTDSY